MDMHPDQLHVTAQTVRVLVHRQCARWRHLPVSAVRSTGTVNALFRIGDGLVARFPLARITDPDGGRARLEVEAQAGRELLGRTRFATPEPVAIGEPGPGYPQAWSVQTWLPGTVASGADPGSSAAFARDLAEFIRSVRSHDRWVHVCLERSAGLLDVPRLRALWTGLRDLPRGRGGDVMNHGDLIPGNVLVWYYRRSNPAMSATGRRTLERILAAR